LRLGTDAEAYEGAAQGASPRRRRAGFTLVEVIVVLVILAILAAIAIPALTGYIDKARSRQIVSRIHTQRTAVQTMISERYAEDGGIKLLTKDVRRTDDIFCETTNSAFAAAGEAYYFFGFTAPGVDEYEKLTGDKESFSSFYAIPGAESLTKFFQTTTDARGAILTYQYAMLNFEPGVTMTVYYIPDINSTNPIVQKYLENLQTNNVPDITSGFNFYLLKGNGYEKQNW
jgi:prepilin-type N-terminal cleavage/methylation domain-containing protein